MLFPSPLRNPNAPVTILAAMMFLIPAVGVPSTHMLQDTLKSAILAFGVLIAALVFFWQQRDRTEPLRWHGLMWLPLALMAYALGSMVWSHTYLAGVEAIRWFILSLLLWLGLNTITRDNVRILLWGIHAGVTVASLWVALQFWVDLQWFPQVAAPASTFVNRNFFAEYAVSVLPLSVWLLASSRQAPWMVWLALSLALNITALLMTGTRSALVAMCVALPIVLLIGVRLRGQLAFSQWTMRQRWLVTLALVGGIGIMGSIPSGNPTVSPGTSALGWSSARTASVAQASEYTTGSFSIRAQMWSATARMLMAHPWTGVGAGAWEVHIPLYQSVDTISETDYYAHNEYLQLLSEYGLVVGGLVGAMLAIYLLRTVGGNHPMPPEKCVHTPVRVFFLCSLLLLLLVSNAGFPWHLAAGGSLLALCLGALAAGDAILPRSTAWGAVALHWRPSYRTAALCLLAMGLALSGYLTQQAARAERLIVRSIEEAVILLSTPPKDPDIGESQKIRVLQRMREGIAINPHYRKLTGTLGDMLAVHGDWANAVWIWESVAGSRPHIAGIWMFLATGYAELGQHDKAQTAWLQLQRLKPQAMETQTLALKLKSRAGQHAEAARQLTALLDQGQYDYDRIQTAYAMGYRAKDWKLALRAMELRNQTWPEQAADGYMRIGKIYMEAGIYDDAKALAAFTKGLASVPAAQRENFRRQVPEPYRSRM